MNDNKENDPGRDLSPRASDILRSDIEDGLRRFRTGNFEARLEARLRGAHERTKRSGRGLRWAWIPALALGLAAAAYFFVLPRAAGRGSGAGLERIADTLSRQPGLRQLNQRLPSPGSAAPPSPAVEAFSRVLSQAARESSSGGGSVTLPAPWPGPLDLRQKMEFLYRDRTIERALLIFVEKSQGGLT